MQRDDRAGGVTCGPPPSYVMETIWPTPLVRPSRKSSLRAAQRARRDYQHGMHWPRGAERGGWSAGRPCWRWLRQGGRASERGKGTDRRPVVKYSGRYMKQKWQRALSPVRSTSEFIRVIFAACRTVPTCTTGW